MTSLIPDVSPRHRVLYVSMFAGFVLFGLNLAAMGPALPKAIREFRWSYTAAGTVVAAGSVGYFVSTFLCGVLIRRLGPKAVIVGGLLVQAVGQGLFGAVASPAVNVACKLLSGAGAGGTEVVVNYAVVHMEPPGRSRLMNLMHAAFAVGAIASPLAMEGLLAAGGRWQWAFRLLSASCLAMAGVMAALPFRRLHDGGREDPAGHPPILEIIRRPLAVLGFLILMVYVGAEIGTSNWVAEYYVVFFRAGKSAASLMVAVFWAGILLGRLGVAAAYRGTRQEDVLLVLSLLATTSLAAALLLPSPWLAAAAFFLTGVGFSAIYPVVMSLLGRHFPRGVSVAVGFAGGGGGVGALVFPMAMAALADAVGLARAFWSYAALNVVLVALVLAAMVVIRRRTAGSNGR